MTVKNSSNRNDIEIRIKKTVTRILGSIVLGMIASGVILSVFEKINAFGIMLIATFIIHVMIMIFLITKDDESVTRSNSSGTNKYVYGWVSASIIMCGLATVLVGLFVFLNTELEKHVFSSLIGFFSYIVAILVLVFDEGFTRRAAYGDGSAKTLGWILISIVIAITGTLLFFSVDFLNYDSDEPGSLVMFFGKQIPPSVVILGGTIITIIWGFSSLYSEGGFRDIWNNPGSGAGP